MPQSLCSSQLIHMICCFRQNRDTRKQGDAKSLPPSEKVYTLAVQGPRIVVGAADRSVLIYDSRYVTNHEASFGDVYDELSLLVAKSNVYGVFHSRSVHPLHPHPQEPECPFGPERVRA